MALSASDHQHNPTADTETAKDRESFEFYDPRGLFSKARRKPSVAVPSIASSPNSERQRAAAGKSEEAAVSHDGIRDNGHGNDTVQDGIAANENAPTETAPIPILSSSASGHHLQQQHEQQPAYNYGHDGLPVHNNNNNNTDERGRLSRLNINDDPTPRNSHSSHSRRRPSDSLASRLLSTSAGARSRSRSRSSSSTEEGRMSDDDNASSILSPAAEFLGSFTSSGTGSGLLGRSTSNAAAKARARANSRSIQQRDRAFSSSSNTANNKASRQFSISSVSLSHHPSFIAPDPDDEGEEVDGYVLLEILGTGTFSTVRKARHIESGTEVAVKIVRHAAFQDQGRNEGGLGMGMSASTSGIGLWSRERDRKTSQSEGLRIASGVTVNGEASPSSSTTNSRTKTAKTKQQRQQASLGYLEVDDIPLRHRSCSSPSITMQLPTFFNHSNGKSPSNHIDGLPPMHDDDRGILEEDMDGDTPMQGLSPLPIEEPRPIPGAENDAAEEGEADDMILDEGLSFADAALQKEVYIWSQLSDHPHIVPLLHFHETDFASFIFMPLCGGNLLQYVRLNGKGNTTTRDGMQNSPPMPMIGSNSTTSLHRSVSITSNASTSSSAGHNTASGGGSGGKIGRSGSIRLRHPGEVVSGGMGLPFSTVQRIFSQIVLGLEYLHLQAKVTHKDIKLENILLDEVNEGGGEGNENFRISDFGLAHAVEIMSASSGVIGGGEPGYISPPWRKGGRFDPRARREHALSDGDAQDIMMSSAPPHAIHFPSLGEAASLILPSSTRDTVPTAGPAAGASAPSMSLPDESLLELRHGSGSQASPHKALKRTATTTSSSPPSSSLSPPTARFKPTRSSLASRRSHIHAIPATLAQLSTTFGDATAGSLQYTSPEQIRSPAPITDYSVDIWALGCVLYAMVEGKLPFDDGFEPRLRVQIMKGEWKTPTALLLQDGEQEEVKKEKRQITDILKGCLEMDAKKRWTIEQVANSEWLLEYMASSESPRSPVSSSRGRGRRPADSRHRRQLDVQNEEGDEEDELHMRSRSRGRRPAMLRRESSQQTGGRTSSSRSGSGSSKRRGPSVDEYRRARGETPTRNSPRSRSAGRRYNGDSLTSWEIL